MAYDAKDSDPYESHTQGETRRAEYEQAKCQTVLSSPFVLPHLGFTFIYLASTFVQSDSQARIRENRPGQHSWSN